MAHDYAAGKLAGDVALLPPSAAEIESARTAMNRASIARRRPRMGAGFLDFSIAGLKFQTRCNSTGVSAAIAWAAIWKERKRLA
jgi:hypothetical protein